jgi:hypothetical protein
MLTMKHIMRQRQGECVEFVRAIGCYAVKRKDGYFQFLAYDQRDTDTPDVWSGWTDTDGTDMVAATIYIMNEAGSTVANYGYSMRANEVEPLWPGAPEPMV